MKTGSIYLTEIWFEARAGLRGPMFYIVALGLTLYVLLVLANADHMREMGATGIPRNSAHLVFLLSSGMSLWLYFVWAWVFGQVVLRDRNANLHENVMSAPVSLTKLLLARYVGASIVGFLLGAIMPLAILLVPLLGWGGIVSADLIGAAPIIPILWSMLIFVLPGTLGIGALYVSAAIWTRSVAGPFVVAAILMIIWMVGMIVLRGGNVSDAAATIFDPSGYAEAELQTNNWTPEEKSNRLLDFSIPLFFNRIVWMVVPMLAFFTLLWRMKRERLVIGTSPRRAKTLLFKKLLSHSSKAVSNDILPPIHTSSWLTATWQEAYWHLRLSFQNWGMLLALSILVLIGIGGAIVHVMQHGDGPMIPRAFYLLPFMADFSYLFMLFMVTGFVGVLARRDLRPGFDEMIDATPTPIGTRVIGRVLAAVMLTVCFAMTPVLSNGIVMAIGSPNIHLLDAFLYQILLITPALLEICALTLLFHALIRNTGTAYAVSMMFGFIAIVNHEVNLVAYPPGQMGLPMHISLSSVTGWQPWLMGLLSMDIWKLSLVGCLAALSWMLWPRGSDLNLKERLEMIINRFREGAAYLLMVSILLASGSGSLLYYKLVKQGDYSSRETKLTDDAAWEKHWWDKADEFSLLGGDIRINLYPYQRSADIDWDIHQYQAEHGRFHASLPEGLSINKVLVNGVSKNVEVAYEHFMLDADECRQEPCEITLNLSLSMNGWPDHERQSWLHPSAVWLRAKDVLPSLGHNSQRRIKIPSERRRFGLVEQTATLPQTALKAFASVAPSGKWTWSINYNLTGTHTDASGTLDGPLDFAGIWFPESPGLLKHDNFTLWHSASYLSTATEIAQDLEQMQQCVAEIFNNHFNISALTIKHVVQTPRHLGSNRVYGSLLWLPEDAGWDVSSQGFGRQLRRADIARALTMHLLLKNADLREEPGTQAMLGGLSGWVGLECVRQFDGKEAWLKLQQWHRDKVVEALGALKEPVKTVALAGQADWVNSYSSLALHAWIAQTGTDSAIQIIAQLLDKVSDNRPFVEVLTDIAGQTIVDQLLGVPTASDIAVSSNERNDLQVRTQRWQWRNGGWKSMTSGDHLVLLSEPFAAPGHLSKLQQLYEREEKTALFLIDSRPSFERTPEDNLFIK